MTPAPTRATERRRMIAVAIGIPAAILVVGLALLLWALPQLPDPMAIHWGPNGQPDGFGSPFAPIVLLVVVIVGYSAFAGYLISRTPETGPVMNQRLTLAIGPFIATLIGIVVVVPTLQQRGLEDARDMGSIFPVLISSFVAAIIVAIGSWALLPSHPAPELSSSDVPLLALSSDENVVWIRKAEPRGVALVIVIALACALALGAVVVLALVNPLGLLTLVILVPLLLLAISSTFWKVTIDRGGFAARGALGVPRFAIPVSDIELATVTHADALSQFGGWGLRWRPNGTGIIVRNGPALEIRRTNGRILVVTIDDAETAAALLNGLKARASA